LSRRLEQSRPFVRSSGGLLPSVHLLTPWPGRGGSTSSRTSAWPPSASPTLGVRGQRRQNRSHTRGTNVAPLPPARCGATIPGRRQPL